MARLPLASAHFLPSHYCKHVLQTPLPQLDDYLSGGFPPGTITEIFGTPSSFKTQFILTVAVHTATLDLPVLILDADATTHASRLLQLALSHSADPISPSPNHHVFPLLNIVPVSDWDSFVATLQLLPTLLTTTHPAIIIVDSMSTLYRTCRLPAASKRLEAAVAKLRHIAVTFSLPIVLTNSARPHHNPPNVLSAMPQSWPYAVSSRILLQRISRSHGVAHLIKSPFTSPTFTCPIPFVVDHSGVHQMQSGMPSSP